VIRPPTPGNSCWLQVKAAFGGVLHVLGEAGAALFCLCVGGSPVCACHTGWVNPITLVVVGSSRCPVLPAEWYNHARVAHTCT
jgi:hypothetical protein